MRALVLILIALTLGCERADEPAQEISMELRQLIERGDAVGIRDAVAQGRASVVDVVRTYLERIETMDRETRAILAINPRAMEEAERMQRFLETAEYERLPPLFGVPVVVKDNIETDEMATTAGSLALEHNITGRDAALIATLRDRGAIVLAKSNLSEWANFRSRHSSSGWSALGGQTGNAVDPTRSPCGSSSGSAVAVALGLAPLAIGTETNGSIICPASVGGVVGIKPTVGLVSQNGIVPISHSQDTAGPMARDVASAALLLSHLQPDHDYTDFSHASLEGKRIGIVRSSFPWPAGVESLFEAAITSLREGGAVIVDDLLLSRPATFGDDSYLVLLYEFKQNLNRYLANLPNELSTQTLEKIIAFNEENAEREMPFFGQDIFLAAQATDNVVAYEEALERVQQAARSDGIDKLLQEHELDAIVAISGGPAWKIDHVLGDRFVGGFSSFPAVAGYPHVTVPMGQVQGLPVGLSFTAGRDDDKNVIDLAWAYEQIRDRE